MCGCVVWTKAVLETVFHVEITLLRTETKETKLGGVIMPNTRFQIRWDALKILVVLYFTVMIPLRVALWTSVVSPVMGCGVFVCIERDVVL